MGKHQNIDMMVVDLASSVMAKACTDALNPDPLVEHGSIARSRDTYSPKRAQLSNARVITRARYVTGVRRYDPRLDSYQALEYIRTLRRRGSSILCHGKRS